MDQQSDYSKTPEGQAIVAAIRELLGEDPSAKTGATHVGVRPYVNQQREAALRYLEALKETNTTRISAREFFSLPDADRIALAARREIAESDLKREQKAFDDFTNALIERWEAKDEKEQQGFTPNEYGE